MALLNSKKLHDETSAVLDEVEKGKSFDIERDGKVIATLEPPKKTWDEIMAPVRALHKKVKGTTPNPVLAERARRRR